MQANFVSKSFKFHNPPFKCYNSKVAKFSFPVFNSITFFKNSGFIGSWISFEPSHFMIFVLGCNTRHSNVISLDKFLQVVPCWYSMYIKTVCSWCLLSTDLRWFMNHCTRVKLTSTVDLISVHDSQEGIACTKAIKRIKILQSSI